MGAQLDNLEYPALQTDQVAYRPMSPMAAVSLAFGLMSVISMSLAEDLGPLSLAVLPITGILLGIRGLQAVKHYDMSGGRLAKFGLVLSIGSLVGGESLRAYILANEAPEGSIRVAYEDLQSNEPGQQIPKFAQDLDGKKVFIRGYVYPGKENYGIKKFVLCRDNGDCCFGGQPKLNDMIEVTLKEPLTLDYDTKLRKVAGVFRVKPETSGGAVGTILYHMEADYLR